MTACVYLNVEGHSFFISDTIVTNEDRYSRSPSRVFTADDIKHRKRSTLCRKLFIANKENSFLSAGSLYEIDKFIDDIGSQYVAFEKQKSRGQIATDLGNGDYRDAEIAFIFAEFSSIDVAITGINSLVEACSPLGQVHAIGSGDDQILERLRDAALLNLPTLRDATLTDKIRFLRLFL